MEKEILEKYKLAGKINKEVLQFGAKLVKEDALICEIADAMELKIKELGGQIAFPVNISINEIAAHYAPLKDDPIKIKPEDYVKLDAGTHIDGYIADAAITVRIAGKDDLIKCSEKMLEEAIKNFIPGKTLGEIGSIIEDTAISMGFKPVRNLTGHTLDQFNLHAGENIPNIRIDERIEIRKGQAYAIEPFCTAGNGWIKDVQPTLIFRYISSRPTRSPEARKILELAKNNYFRLPFAKRWLQKQISPLKVEQALRQLQMNNSIYGYQVLKETSGQPVAQTEHTLIAMDTPIVTTR